MGLYELVALYECYKQASLAIWSGRRSFFPEKLAKSGVGRIVTLLKWDMTQTEPHTLPDLPAHLNFLALPE